MWLERHLGLVPAARANGREILPRSAAAPVPARRLARLAHRPSRRPATGAALRVGHEPLLRVVLLILGRVDELSAAIDACQGSIDVAHDVPPRDPLYLAEVPGSASRPTQDRRRRHHTGAGCVRTKVVRFSCPAGTRRQGGRIPVNGPLETFGSEAWERYSACRRFGTVDERPPAVEGAVSPGSEPGTIGLFS
jgi:hypothetical protein